MSHRVQVAGAAGYGSEAAAILFYCAGNGEGWYRDVYGVEFSEDVLPRREFDVRADAVDDNACGGWDVHGVYGNHIAFYVDDDK